MGLRKICIAAVYFFIFQETNAQTFIRSELNTGLTVPWEIIYGPDGFLWLSESGGKVSRVDPINGNRSVVFTASDYFGGSVSEQLNLCHQPNIGSGTLGMALHPDFTGSSPYIYLVYSYNSGTALAPATKFKIERLTWNSVTSAVVSNTMVVGSMPNGYDHLGGRLMVIPQNGNYYLFFTVGDNGVSEINSPSCYNPQSNNPNNFVQDPNYKNGKVHRFNMDGSIPSDNPIAGNSFYTRAHRNPQGLMYNPAQNVIYEIEHGDRTDDEINILISGKNYGWKTVRGFHSDNNYPGEASYVANYQPNPNIPNDALVEPLYAWCSTAQPTIGNNIDWCTVAPSDGIYYGSSGIPEWTNSLLVVTLKNGSNTDNEVYQFKLNAAGTALDATVPVNPRKFFAQDQALNGRLRDITCSPDGKKIYLINNGGTNADKIVVYSLDPNGLNDPSSSDFKLEVSPNPTEDYIAVNCSCAIATTLLYNSFGENVETLKNSTGQFKLHLPNPGVFFVKFITSNGKIICKKVIRL